MTAACAGRVLDRAPHRVLREGAALLLVSALAGCAASAPAPSRISASVLAAAAGWQAVRIPAAPFVLAAWAPAAGPSAHLNIYIEGDGQAWLSSTRVADDPTPRDPLALRLALAEPGEAAYLARPCQYLGATELAACDSGYWTGRRFAPEVIAATSTAIDALKARHGSVRLTLIGYSGGGAVAALVAARRNDVARLITVAATLDHARWTDAHAVTPLVGSLNPADAWRELGRVPQVHFVGAEDAIVEPAIAAAYRARFPPSADVHVETIAGFDHRCCWVERWPALRAAADALAGEQPQARAAAASGRGS